MTNTMIVGWLLILGGLILSVVTGVYYHRWRNRTATRVAVIPQLYRPEIVKLREPPNVVDLDVYRRIDRRMREQAKARQNDEPPQAS